MLLIYIFTVLTMNLFAPVKLNGSLNNFANFQGIRSASLTLSVMTTGDSYFEILYSLSRLSNVDYECIADPTYEDYVNNGYEAVGCGNIASSSFVFIIFIVMVILIFLNLFIAIIL